MPIVGAIGSQVNALVSRYPTTGSPDNRSSTPAPTSDPAHTPVPTITGTPLPEGSTPTSDPAVLLSPTANAQDATRPSGNPIIDLGRNTSETCKRIWDITAGPDTNFEGDTWDLTNNGTAPLVIDSVKTSCPECLTANVKTMNLAPGADTQLVAGYRPIKDRDTTPDHEHLITVRSNATNCPVLSAVIIIGYRDGYAPPEETLQGHELYDDFTDAAAFDDKWRKKDEHRLCDFEVGGRQLSFNCTNTSAQDRLAELIPNVPFGKITGLAGWAQADVVGGEFKLAMAWPCGEGGEQREYHMNLGPHEVTVKEFYPLSNWDHIELGTLAVSPGWSHLLQIEQVPEGIAFYVDRQPLSLSTPPDLPACAVPHSESFGFLVWSDNNSIIGHLEEVYIRR